MKVKPWRIKRRTFAKKNVRSASVSLVGLKSWIKIGIAWSIAQTNVAASKSMKGWIIKKKISKH